MIRKIQERILMSCHDPKLIKTQVDGKDSKDMSRQHFVVQESPKLERLVKGAPEINSLEI